MMVRLCDECLAQTHSVVEIDPKDATVYFRDPDNDLFSKGRMRFRKRNGDIKRRFYEIDLCHEHWPDFEAEPPTIPGNPKNVKIFWNPEKLKSHIQADNKPDADQSAHC